MKTKCLLGLSAAAFAAITLSSCDTPTGRGAAIGAGTGAVVGGPVGAVVGAAGGALVGAAVEEKRAAEYGPVPSGGYPVAQSTGQPGMYTSPYTHKMYDLHGVPRGGLVRDVDTNHLFRKP